MITLRHGRHLDRRQPDRRRDRHDDGIDGRRLPGAAADHRHPHRRRGRRIDCVRRQRRRAAGRARGAPVPIRGRSATARARSSRSPTRTCCSAASIRSTSSAAAWRSTSSARGAPPPSWPRRLGVSEPALAEGIVRVANANMERAIASCRCSAATIRVSSRCWRSAAPAACTPARLPTRSTSATVIVAASCGRAVRARHAAGRRHQGLLADGPAPRRRAPRSAQLDATLLQPLVDAGGSRTARPRDSPPVRARGDRRRRSMSATSGSRTRSRCRSPPDYREEFDRQHARLYGYSNPERADRSRQPARCARPASPTSRSCRDRASRDPSKPEPVPRRPAQFGGKVLPTGVLPLGRSRSRAASAAAPPWSPARQATAVMPPGFSFRIDEFGNLLAAVRPPRRARQAAGAAAVAMAS